MRSLFTLFLLLLSVNLFGKAAVVVVKNPVWQLEDEENDKLEM